MSDTSNTLDTSNTSDTSNTFDTSNKSDTSTISDTSTVEDLIYDTSLVSKILGVQESTLRKYCALMQKHNYEFNKNSVGHRIFYKKDIEIIRKIVELKNSSSLTLNQSVKTILESDIEDIDDITAMESISAVEPISNPAFNMLIEAFSTFQNEQQQFKNEQQQFNKQLLEQLQKQQDYIKNSIDERDKKLMLSIKESMEMRRQLAAAEEEKEKENLNNNKKRKWWRFWT
ncbi:hypothetical protein [Rummeliibacillus pycnus]|uniref:hypothetical protein n=1 Tax=Rummeliibacillus pycnus TaxID=101070 RepID=UPI003D287EC0